MGRIGVGTVHKQLHGRYFGSCCLGGKAWREDHHQIGLVLAESLVRLTVGMQKAHHTEVGILFQTLRQTLFHRVAGIAQHQDTGILHLGRDGKTEEQNLRDGHAQQNQHGALVAEDVEKLYFDKSQKFFHLLVFFVKSTLPYMPSLICPSELSTAIFTAYTRLERSSRVWMVLGVNSASPEIHTTRPG